MGDRLLWLAAKVVHVAPHVRVRDGKVQHVEGYTRALTPRQATQKWLGEMVDTPQGRGKVTGVALDTSGPPQTSPHAVVAQVRVPGQRSATYVEVERWAPSPLKDKLAEDRARAAEAAKPKVTLYRGEGSHANPSPYYTGPHASEAGGWWTTDLESATRYAIGSKGKVYTVEVTESEAEKRGLGWFITDPEVRARRTLHSTPKPKKKPTADIQFEPIDPNIGRSRGPFRANPTAETRKEWTALKRRATRAEKLAETDRDAAIAEADAIEAEFQRVGYRNYMHQIEWAPRFEHIRTLARAHRALALRSDLPVLTPWGANMPGFSARLVESSEMGPQMLKLARTRVRPHLRKVGSRIFPVEGYLRREEIHFETDENVVGSPHSWVAGSVSIRAKVPGTRTENATLNLTDLYPAKTDTDRREFQVDSVFVPQALRGMGIAVKMAEEFHRDYPNDILVHGDFSSPEGIAFAEYLTKTYPDWNRFAGGLSGLRTYLKAGHRVGPDAEEFERRMQWRSPNPPSGWIPGG